MAAAIFKPQHAAKQQRQAASRDCLGMQAVFSQHATLPLQGSKNGHKEEKDGAQAEPWTIKIDRGNEVEGHVPNSIKTAKYNAVTFFPIFLVEMFSRVAYLYFLAQVSSLTENAHSMMSMSCPVTQALPVAKALVCMPSSQSCFVIHTIHS